MLLVEAVSYGMDAVAVPAPARVANDLEEPRTPVAAGKRAEISKRAERCFLHRVFRIVAVSHEPARKATCGVKVRNDDFVERENDHGSSVVGRGIGDHRQHPHRNRTAPVRPPVKYRVVKGAVPGSFGAQLKALREGAGFTQEELATIAGLSVHAVSALERGQRTRPHVDTVRALSAALDLTAAIRDTLLASARAPAHAAVDELSSARCR